MRGMFAGSNFNADIGKWDVSKVYDMTSLFANDTSFNQDISKWNVSNVKNMLSMFSLATSFNQDISRWDISNVTNMSNMFHKVTLSTNIYDKILTSWSRKIVKHNVIFDAGNSKYSPNVRVRRDVLTDSNSFNWTIKDGGMLSTKSTSKLFKTGQKKVYTKYDDGYYQLGREHNLTRNNNMVIDYSQNLTWLDDSTPMIIPIISPTDFVSLPNLYVNFNTAKEICETLVYGEEYTNWRLPTIQELINITDKSNSNPALNSIFQIRPNIKGTGHTATYWSSTTYNDPSTNKFKWILYEVEGNPSVSGMTNSQYFRCVRDGIIQ